MESLAAWAVYHNLLKINSSVLIFVVFLNDLDLNVGIMINKFASAQGLCRMRKELQSRRKVTHTGAFKK